MRGGWIACGLWLLLALPAAGAVAASPVAVRSGTHHGFGRLVFDFPTRVGWHMVRHGDVVRLRFDRRLPFGPDPSLPRNVRAFADAPGRAEVTVVPGARLRRLRVGARLVLDVLDPPRPRARAPERAVVVSRRDPPLKPASMPVPPAAPAPGGASSAGGAAPTGKPAVAAASAARVAAAAGLQRRTPPPPADACACAAFDSAALAAARFRPRRTRPHRICLHRTRRHPRVRRRPA